MDFKTVVRQLFTLVASILVIVCANLSAAADGIVSQVVSAPVFANGIVRDERIGINIYLQNDEAQGLDFMDPKVLGYGIPAGGQMEVELVSGFQRDPNIPLDDRALLLVAGTPQQGLPDNATDHIITEGNTKNTFFIIPKLQDGLLPETLVSPTPGAKDDPIPQRGIKIIHIGRVSAFISRGESGVIEVRIRDRRGNVIASGRQEYAFLPEPIPQVFPTNIPHDLRNHNWQRIAPGQVLGVANKTLPLPVLLFDRNEGIGNVGILGAGVLSKTQLIQSGYKLPKELENIAGLILRDANNDELLDVINDEIVGVVKETVPEDAQGQQVLTPLVNEKPFLSVSTSQFNPRAGASVGGAIMQVVYISGDKPGLYNLSFSLFENFGDITSKLSPPTIYTVVVEDVK